MKIWIYVEGESDASALTALWGRWQKDLREKGWGFRFAVLDNKSQFFRKIGPRSAEKLIGNDNDLVVGLPDLYPNNEYAGSRYKHDDLEEMRAVQRYLVQNSLATVYNSSSRQIDFMLDRFCGTAFKYDSEMLLLAARNKLRDSLGTPDALGRWQHPVEDQNQTKPPKRIVEDLFLAKKGRRYRDTTDAKAILEKVTDIRKEVLYTDTDQLQCPVFKDLMDWIAAKTGVCAY